MQLFEFRISKNTDIEAFYKMMREQFPDIIGRKRFCCHLNENTQALRNACAHYSVSVCPIPTFMNTDFTKLEILAIKTLFAEYPGCLCEVIREKLKKNDLFYYAEDMAHLKDCVDNVASKCGGGEDTIGAFMYTGAFRVFGPERGDQLVNLTKKIDSHEDYDLRKNEHEAIN